MVVNIVLTVLLAFIVKLQEFPCPVQSLVQSEKFQPAFGVAVRVTGSFK